MVFTMLVAVYTVHWGVFSNQKQGMEYPLTLAVVLAALGLLGAGRLKISALFPCCSCRVSGANGSTES